jgi:hypothetical protein
MLQTLGFWTLHPLRFQVELLSAKQALRVLRSANVHRRAARAFLLPPRFQISMRELLGLVSTLQFRYGGKNSDNDVVVNIVEGKQDDAAPALLVISQSELNACLRELGHTSSDALDVPDEDEASAASSSPEPSKLVQWASEQHADSRAEIRTALQRVHDDDDDDDVFAASSLYLPGNFSMGSLYQQQQQQQQQ